MANRKVRFIGGQDERVAEFDGQQFLFKRNHQVEVPEEFAKSLVRSAKFEYVKDEPKAKDAPKATADKE